MGGCNGAATRQVVDLGAAQNLLRALARPV